MTHQARRVAVDDASRELLQELHLRARERALSVGVALADDAFLFSEEADGAAPWRPDVCTQLVRPAPGGARARPPAAARRPPLRRHCPG